MTLPTVSPDTIPRSFFGRSMADLRARHRDALATLDRSVEDLDRLVDEFDGRYGDGDVTDPVDVDRWSRVLERFAYAEAVAGACEAEHDRRMAASQRRAEERERLMEAMHMGTVRTETGTDNNSDAPSVAVGGVGDPWAIRSGLSASNATELRGRALAAIERTDAPDDGRQMLTEMLERHPADHDESTLAARWVIATSDEEYRSAVSKLLVDPQHGHREFTGRELAAYQRAQHVARALSIGDGSSSAGLMAPYTLDPSWQLTSAGEIDPVRQLARVVSIAGYEWRGVTTAGVSAHWRAEAAEVDDDSPTLAQPVIRPERADVFVPFSFEAQEDALQLEAQLREAMADARANLEAAGWISGAGAASNEPTGIVTALDGSASEVSPATGETYAAADVRSLLKAVPPRFRSNTTVLMDYATYLVTRDFAPGGSTTSAPFFNDDETRLLGKPWREATAMRSTDDINTSATADNHILIAGDFRRGYTIVDRVGMRVELVPHLFGANRRPTGQRGLFAYWRTSGGVTNLNALRSLNVATTA